VSIFFVFIIASITRCDFSRSGSPSNSGGGFGTIRQDGPSRFFSGHVSNGKGLTQALVVTSRTARV